MLTEYDAKRETNPCSQGVYSKEEDTVKCKITVTSARKDLSDTTSLRSRVKWIGADPGNAVRIRVKGCNVGETKWYSI